MEHQKPTFQQLLEAGKLKEAQELIEKYVKLLTKYKKIEKYKSSSRCTKMGQEAHHVNRGKSEEKSLNTLSNAEWLCRECHDYVKQKKGVLKGTPDFSNNIIQKTKERASNQCECTRQGCPHNKHK